MRQFAEQLRFAQEAITHGAMRKERMQRLDRHLAFVQAIVAAREPHLAHAALADFADDAIRPKLHVRLQRRGAARIAAHAHESRARRLRIGVQQSAHAHMQLGACRCEVGQKLLAIVRRRRPAVCR